MTAGSASSPSNSTAYPDPPKRSSAVESSRRHSPGRELAEDRRRRKREAGLGAEVGDQEAVVVALPAVEGDRLGADRGARARGRSGTERTGSPARRASRSR